MTSRTTPVRLPARAWRHIASLAAWAAIPLSALLFALAHGINPVFPVALVVGILATVLFKLGTATRRGQPDTYPRNSPVPRKQVRQALRR